MYSATGRSSSPAMGLGSSGSPSAPGGSVDAGEILDPGRARRPAGHVKTRVRWTCLVRALVATCRAAVVRSGRGPHRRRDPAAAHHHPVTSLPRRATGRAPAQAGAARGPGADDDPLLAVRPRQPAEDLLPL